MIFGPCQETSCTAITLNLESNFYSSREEPFPIPLKYIDVSRITHTNLDVKQEKRINDCWNIDGQKTCLVLGQVSLSFFLLEEKPPDGFLWSGRRFTRNQQTSRPDHL